MELNDGKEYHNLQVELLHILGLYVLCLQKKSICVSKQCGFKDHFKKNLRFMPLVVATTASKVNTKAIKNLKSILE